ncbi:SH3-like domain-containing protein [Sphingomonas gellani]|uniref:SH3-like domain-containing protein n=1 Tax=Sphingomonas gellani TaxID=1166340 RepID=A0A1H8EWU3_9SPHN|nr:SH3 domain-containing protein [Sphingomonas gellani]SEN23208.1 SH3-like domain-containing protein [Sphingomonas gellani]
MSSVVRLVAGMLLCAALAPQADAAASKKQPPYFGSIAAGRARMRTGPARTYPASWLYQRADLPIRVVAVFKEWRRVEDPDGTQGWMQANLLSERRTAVVRSPQPIPMLDRPTPGGHVMWRAAPGVVGRISECGNGWCRMDVKGQAGFVETSGLWGVDAGETLP